MYNLVFIKFKAKIKSKIFLNSRDPLATIDDKKRVSEWLVPPKKNDVPPSKGDDEVFPREPLTWRKVEKSSEAITKKRKSSRTKQENV